MPRAAPRRSRGINVRSLSDDYIATQGAVGIRIDASAANLSMVFFFNADTDGRACDVTSLYAAIDGSGVGQVGWYQGVQGNQQQQSAHSILNAAAPAVFAYSFVNTPDPSIPIMRFGASNGAMITSPTGRMWRIPAGYSLVVRPKGANVGIDASIIFNMRP